MSISGLFEWFLSKEPTLRSTIGIISIYLVFITVLGTAIINWLKLYKTVFGKHEKAVEQTNKENEDDTAGFTGTSNSE
jgi:hypothetical protein